MKRKSLFEGLENALSILKLFWKEILYFALIYTAIIFYPVKNVVTFNLIILTFVLSRKLFMGVPVFNDWFKAIIKTVCFVTIIYYLVNLIGGFGILGLVIIVFGFAGWRIKKHWKFFNYVIDWSANRLKGKKEAFSFGDEKNKKRKR